MRILLRILPFVFFIWLICYFFCSLGRKRTLGDQKQKGESLSKAEYEELLKKAGFFIQETQRSIFDELNGAK